MGRLRRAGCVEPHEQNVQAPPRRPRQAGSMTATDPVHLPTILASFSDVYNPRIVTRVNDYDVRIAHVRGEHVWHVHEDTDEFFLVLDGEFEVALREAEAEAEADRTVRLHQGDVFVVPRGTWHRPSSPGGGSI